MRRGLGLLFCGDCFSFFFFFLCFVFPFSSGIILKLVVFVILLIDCVVSQKLSSHFFFFSLPCLFESVAAVLNLMNDYSTTPLWGARL